MYCWIKWAKSCKIKKAQKSIKNSIPFLFDLTKKKNLENLKSQIKKKFKKLDYLICNIGSSDKKKIILIYRVLWIETFLLL